MGRITGKGMAVALCLALAAPAASAQASNLDRARALMARGLAHAGEGARAEALVDFTAAISLHAFSGIDLARALFDRGVTLDGMGRVHDAIGDYSSAIAIAPNFTPALNNRANAYRRLGRLDDAKRDYIASLAAGNPTPEYSYYGLGQIAEAEGNRQAARDAYERAVAADPHYALAGQRLAALSTGAPSRAIILKPPPAAAPAPRIALRPPPPAKPRITQANYDRSDTGTGLRPSEDAAASAAGGPLIQLGAWRDEASAADGWNHARAKAGGVLAGLTPRIVAADVPGKGLYFRLRANLAPGQSASSVCAALTAQGLGCMVVKGD
jgi:tetratricopeptide (TPR) repeat protein